MGIEHSVLPLGGGLLELKISSATDRGAVRAANEDSLYTGECVFVVADGMGGHERGDVASRTAVAVFEEQLPPGVAPTPARVLDTIERANIAVRSLSEMGEEGRRVAGTTVTGIALVDVGEADRPYWMAFNIGDSRVYTWDGRTLEQLTVDHSAVQELVDAGEITAEQAADHPERNVITRALGAEDAVDADVWLIPAAGVQTFLICSDGLSKELSDSAIAREIAGADGRSPAALSIAARLVAAAIENGGRDNVSVIVVESSTGVEADRDTATNTRGLAVGAEDTAPRVGRGA